MCCSYLADNHWTTVGNRPNPRLSFVIGSSREKSQSLGRNSAERHSKTELVVPAILKRKWLYQRIGTLIFSPE
jgi:hypothetical protein